MDECLSAIVFVLAGQAFYQPGDADFIQEMVTETDGGGLHFISSRMVETMGGRIRVESQVGRGEDSTLLPGSVWTEVHDLNDSVGSHPAAL